MMKKTPSRATCDLDPVGLPSTRVAFSRWSFDAVPNRVVANLDVTPSAERAQIRMAQALHSRGQCSPPSQSQKWRSTYARQGVCAQTRGGYGRSRTQKQLNFSGLSTLHRNLVVNNKIDAEHNKNMLKLTPQQIAQVVQLSDQTLRHWRQVLPPLVGLNGYSPCFAPGDALALLVVRYLVKVMGISVGVLASASVGLFDLCRNNDWPHLADRRLLVHVERGEVLLLSHDSELEEPAILIPMRPFAEQLQAAWGSNFPPISQLPPQFSAAAVSHKNLMTEA